MYSQMDSCVGVFQAAQLNEKAQKHLLTGDSSRLEQIMSKRTAVDEVFVYPEKKRQHQEAADKAEDISAINQMALNSGVINVSTSLTSTTNFETAAFSPSQKDTASVAGVMEDSQIEVTPDAKQILNSKPNMPGFRLNQCRSFPSPKFDVEEKEPEALKTVSKSKCSNVQSLEKQSHRQQRPRHKPPAQKQKEQVADKEMSDTITSKKAESTNSGNSATDLKVCPKTKQKSPNARKRHTPIKDNPGTSCSSSMRKTMKVEAVSHHKPSSVPETKKGKRSVLPAALLNQIVKTVQSNVRTISTQVVAASAVKSPEKPTPACQTSENPRFCKTSSDGAAKDNARQDAVQDIVPVMQKERLVKKISVSNMKVEGSEVDSSDTSRQGDGKQQKACERGTMVKDTERLTSSKTKEQSLHNAKSQKSNKSLLHADEMPVKPAELEGASTYEKAKTKSKKANRKTNTRGHKRSGADYHESPLGVLPEYIPENDSRLNKTSEPGRVYNLSTLFSGKLGEGRREQTKRKRPNYFFAVQITNTEVKENLTRLQKDVEEAEPKLKPAFVSVDSAHITLGIMHLGDQEAINRAKAGLHDFQTSHHQQQHHLQLQLSEGEEGEGFGSSDPLVLEVRGLDHFNNNVVFAKVTQGDSLKKLEAIADLLKSCALKQKINLDEKEFAAHLTVMKHSKNPAKLKKSGIKKISSDVYQASRDKIFGVELVTTVQLCSMLKPKKNNYYHIEHEVSLTLKAVSDECATDDG